MLVGMATQLQPQQVVTEEDFRAHHGFDLTSFDNVPEQQVQRNSPVADFMVRWP